MKKMNIARLVKKQLQCHTVEWESLVGEFGKHSVVLVNVRDSVGHAGDQALVVLSPGNNCYVVRTGLHTVECLPRPRRKTKGPQKIHTA